MRTSRILLSCLAALALLSAGIAPGKAIAEEGGSFLKVPVGLSYASTYWWRGVELNGKGSGVLWPSAGLVLGDTGISLLVAAGLNADYLLADRSGDHKYIRPTHEIDYGASFAKDLGDIASFSLGNCTHSIRFMMTMIRMPSTPPFWKVRSASALNPFSIRASTSTTIIM